MKIHEYQAKEIFSKYDMPIPVGKVAETPQEVKQIANEIGLPIVIKSQVHVGGRGKAGGIKLVKDLDKVEEVAGQILGMEIKGLTVKKVLVTKAVDIGSEAYLGVIVDRKTQQPVMIVSAAGGIDIEEVARETPEKIHKLNVDPVIGLLPHQAKELAFKLYPDKPTIALKTSDILLKLYKAFIDSDASLAEINPFVVTPNDEIWVVDAKINIDDNALYRRKDIAQMRDLDSEVKEEIEARENDLSYVKLEGNIGCIVNGAGLAMATMDLIKYYGGQPANFLDIGGSSNPKKVIAAMKIITRDKNVKAVLFNIFGGITRCDDVANGLVSALKEIEVKIPIVIRLTGTNQQEGRKILEEHGLVAVDSMDEVVQKAIEMAKQQ